MKSFIPIIAIVTQALLAGDISLLQQETIEIPVAQYRTVRFALPEYQSLGASLRGTVNIYPDTASVEFILLHIDDYLRWRSSAGGVDTLDYVSTAAGSFVMGIPGLGSYALVVSNRGNFHPLTVTLDLEVLFEGSGATGDPLPSALRLALLLIMAGIAAIAIGSVLQKHSRRKGA
jgi:hypothetical protein